MRSRFFLVATSTVVILLTSCSEEDPKPVFAPPPAPKYISMSVTVSPPIILFGQGATVVLDVTNTGPDSISLYFECDDPFAFILESEDGSFTFKSFSLCLGPPHAMVLAPGETRTARMATPSSLAPMIYFITAGMVEYEKEYPWVSTRLIVRPR